MRLRDIGLALIACSVWIADAPAQDRPRVGVGAAAGTVLGAELVQHEFDASIDDEPVRLIQEVHVRDVALAGIHAEWYATDHIALRVQASWGAGRVTAQTYREQNGDTEVDAFHTGFGDVRVAAADAGVSIWPWTPRSVGFAPFVTAGFGTLSYDFRPPDSADGEPFFLAAGSRRRNAVVVGLGTDMRVWQSVTLRMEATNHLVDSPVDASDFAEFGEARPAANGALTDRVSNVRLVLGMHVYLPFGGQTAIED